MGLARAEIGLANAREDALQPMAVNGLVDSGALHLCIPQKVADPIEDMDVVIHPSRQTLTVNPNSPNIAASLAMGFRTSHA